MFAFASLRGGGRVAVLFSIIFTFVGCTTPQPFFKQADQYAHAFSKEGRHAYILQFDTTGRLMNFSTLFQAINEIRESATNSSKGGPITNLLVLSYGWNHDIDSFESDYAELLTNYDNYVKSCDPPLAPGRSKGPTAIICVSWPSGYSMMSKSLSDLVPGNTLPGTLTAPLELAFPFSVWAKTSLADRIGYGDLQQALAYLYSKAYEGDFQPNIYLIGHSFGCRIISGVVRSRPPPLKFFAFGALVKGFTHTNLSRSAYTQIEALRHRIKGVVLIQPAMAKPNLPDSRDCKTFPVLVTQSRHDHLNGFLYPIASIPFNGYWSAEIDARFAQSFYRRPSLTQSQQQSAEWLLYLRRLTFEVLRIPISVIDSIELLPWSYACGQYWELAGRDNWTLRTNYITSTLAQIPFVKIPIQQLGINAGYHKGLFDLGLLHESAGRINFQRKQPVDASETVDSLCHPTGLTIKTNGVQFVNCDDVISRSIVSDGVDYRNPLWDYSLGELDPVGSHDDYTPVGATVHPEIFDWINFLLQDSILGVPTVARR